MSSLTGQQIQVISVLLQITCALFAFGFLFLALHTCPKLWKEDEKAMAVVVGVLCAAIVVLQLTGYVAAAWAYPKV